MKRNKLFAGALALAIMGASLLTSAGTISVYAENQVSTQSEQREVEQLSQMVLPVSVSASAWKYKGYGTWKELNLKVNDTIYSLPKDGTVNAAIQDGDRICVLAGASYELWSGSIEIVGETIKVNTASHCWSYYLIYKDGSLIFTGEARDYGMGAGGGIVNMRAAYDFTAKTENGVPLAGIRIVDSENNMLGYPFGADYLDGVRTWGDGNSVTWDFDNDDEGYARTSWSAICVTDEKGYTDMSVLVEPNYDLGKDLLCFAGGQIGCSYKYYSTSYSGIFANNGLVNIEPNESYGLYTLKSMGVSISPVVYDTDEILGDNYKKIEITLQENSVTLQDASGKDIATVTMGMSGLRGAVTSMGNNSYFVGKDGITAIPYSKVKMADGVADWTVKVVYDDDYNYKGDYEYSISSSWLGGFRISAIKKDTTSSSAQNISIKKANVKLSKTSYTYNGNERKPSVTVTLDGKKLKKGTDYTVSYKNNKNIGKATVTITGNGSYTGTISKTFTIAMEQGKVFTSGKYKYKVTGTSTVAFHGIASTGTTKVTIPETVKYGGKTFKVTSISEGALKNKTKVTSVTIGANVTKIGANAFWGCKKLSTVTMGKAVTTIGTSAFEGCTKLSKVTMGSAVTTIGTKAFKNCTALKSITVPAKVTQINKQAFYGCKNLKTITIKSTALKAKTVGANVFKGIHTKAKIKVPKKKLASYKKVLKGKGQGSKVTIVEY